MLLAYDGTGFRGWAAQRDPTIRTVQRSLTEAIEPVLGHRVTVVVAGRTDAGVHARGQVASFDATSQRAPHAIRDAINGRLAPEVVAIDVREASRGFHARFSASAREYRYRIDVGPVPDPFTAAFVWHHRSLPIWSRCGGPRSTWSASIDFASFCRHPGAGKVHGRAICSASAVQRRGDRLEIGFRANALPASRWIRALTGTLVAVGQARSTPTRCRGSLAAEGPRGGRRQMVPRRTGSPCERVHLWPPACPLRGLGFL